MHACNLYIQFGQRHRTTGKIGRISDSGLPGPLAHLQSQQTGFGAADSLSAVSLLLIEKVAASIESVNLTLALLLFV